MNPNQIKNLQARTDSKIRYAQIHLDELIERNNYNGDDFERAHQESFLYHLLGAKESFIIELNTYYNTGLVGKGISMGNIRKELKSRGLKSEELKELFLLEEDDSSWLFHAKSMRDYSTHIANVPLHFNVGGEDENLTFISNPKTGKVIERHFIEEFNDWILIMKETIQRLRNYAITNLQSE